MKLKQNMLSAMAKSPVGKMLTLSAAALAGAFTVHAQPVAKCQNNITLNVWCTPVGLPVYVFNNGSSGYSSISASFNGTTAAGPNGLLYFDCSNAGTNAVTLTVSNGASSASCVSSVHVNCHAPKCSINVTPGTAGNGTPGKPYSVYIGYGSPTIRLYGPVSSYISNYSWTLTPLTSGGAANLTCSATTLTAASSSVVSGSGCSSVDFTGLAEGLYNVTMTAYSDDDPDNKKCTATCSVTICVMDVTDDLGDLDIENDNSGHCDGKDKVDICHWDATKSKYKTMKVCPADVMMHLGHGDYLGKCDKQCGVKKDKGPVTSGTRMSSQSAGNGELQLTLAPNPTANDFHISIKSDIAANADVLIYDLAGRVIEQHLSQSIASEIIVGKNLAPGMYVIGVKQGDQTKMIEVVKQ